MEDNNTKTEMLSRKLKAFLENAVRRQRFIESSGLDTYDHLYKNLKKKIFFVFIFVYSLIYPILVITEVIFTQNDLDAWTCLTVKLLGLNAVGKC